MPLGVVIKFYWTGAWSLRTSVIPQAPPSFSAYNEAMSISGQQMVVLALIQNFTRYMAEWGGYT